MAKKYRKPAPENQAQPAEKDPPKKRDHQGVPQLAAEIAGVSVWMAYKVLYGKAQSKKVEKAIEQAKRKLGVAA